MDYGAQEFAYAQPFADTLASDGDFRSWVIGRTIFASQAQDAHLLDREMWATRAPGSKTWWRSHYTEACRCEGDCGKETDLLAIFAGRDGYRFAIHIEVKRPGDRFGAGQAKAYPIRAQCWITKPPRSVLPHSAATTALLCGETDLMGFGSNVSYFPTVFTFEEISRTFPLATRAAAAVESRSVLAKTLRPTPARYQDDPPRKMVTTMDWDAATEDARTHIRERTRTFPATMMLALVDKLCLDGQVTQQDLLAIAPSTDAIGTTLGHVTTAVHGSGSVPEGGWYSRPQRYYTVHPGFAAAWIKLRRLQVREA